MSSGSTGYDSKTYESIKYWYDTQAWLPKNAVIVNQKAFDALDKPDAGGVLKAAAEPRSAAGSCARKRTTGTRRRWPRRA
jgi:TRAP-type C4-dicarboxylate transport system substrate-binding protein